MKLPRTVTVPVIESADDLAQALARLNEVFMAEDGSLEADERNALALVIEDYERKAFPIEAPDPITAIRFAMEQRGYSRKYVAEVLGGASRLSEIMQGRRTLSLSQIRKLHERLQIPYESLFPSQETDQSRVA